MAQAAPAGKVPALANPALILSDGEGGEGGGNAVTTYKLDSTDPNAFAFDGKETIASYANHVHASYAKAKADADTLAAAIDALLDAPSETSLAAARAAWVAARPAYLHTVSASTMAR